MLRLIVYLLAAIVVFPSFAGSYDDFFRAIVRDDASAVRKWVERGFDPNAPDDSGQLAIIRALQAESYETALALASLAQLDPHARNRSGETALMMAALKGRLDVCRALIARGAALDQPGWTALHYAASGNSLEVTELLIERGARVDARAPNGRTPLMLAVLHADEALVDALLAAGADRTVLDRNDIDAAELARRAGREHLERRLGP